MLVFDLGKQHPNLWLAGRPGAGVDLAVRTLVTALAEQHTPDEVELYRLAFNGGALLPFKDLPHTAGYYVLRDEDGLRSWLAALQAEVDRRRSLFAAVGVDTAEHYRQKTGETLSSIVVMVDGFDVLYREAQLGAYDSALAELKDRIEGLLRAGCDLHLVLTTVTATLFRDGIDKNVTGRIALQLQERADYLGVLGAPPPFLIDEGRGRALWREGSEVVECKCPRRCSLRMALPRPRRSLPARRRWPASGPTAADVSRRSIVRPVSQCPRLSNRSPSSRRRAVDALVRSSSTRLFTRPWPCPT